MNELFQVAAELQNVCRGQQWRFCFIGGVALQRWGEPRVTQDVDLSLLTGFGTEGSYIDILLQKFPPRIAEAAQFAQQHRVLLLKSASGVGIDIALGGTSFEESVVSRATEFEFLPKLSLLTCSAEDLIVLKAFADRARDWADIEGIISRQGDRLDWHYVEEQLQPLVELKEEPEIIKRLQTLRG
ncbi:MAG: nucleotidyl transferase AbiEii/AbiGii toxin family protein [Pirellulales bacterium]|nr:nucleotidyl transferase AbiEii/AbiGii toxin family protein [Pirellulales bacterium]